MQNREITAMQSKNEYRNAMQKRSPRCNTKEIAATQERALMQKERLPQH